MTKRDPETQQFVKRTEAELLEAVEKSKAQVLAELTKPDRDEWITELSEDQRVMLQHSWDFWGRPKQLEGFDNPDYSIWMVMSGRGFGKTRLLSEYCHHKAEEQPGSAGSIVGRTAADVRDVVIFGPAGILATQKPWLPVRYEPAKKLLRWSNGTTAKLFSSEEPDQLRGQNAHWAACDEFATWKKIAQAEGGSAWDQVRLSTRLPYKTKDGKPLHPQVLVVTTPKTVRHVKELLREAELSPDRVLLTCGSTDENKQNLDANALAALHDKYDGTRLGRQELGGELLPDNEGQLVHQDIINDSRLILDPADLAKLLDSLTRIVIGVDPSGGAGEQGIVAVGKGPCPFCEGRPVHVYVLKDASCKKKPEGWSKQVVGVYEKFGADRIVGERNYGGDMVEGTIRTADANVSYKSVTATRGKVVRFEPVSSLYEQGKLHHIGNFPELEAQVCGFTTEGYIGPGSSPDRADAMTWAVTELMSFSTRRPRIGVLYDPRTPYGY
jgi:phage terminase large subunit-like protein